MCPANTSVRILHVDDDSDFAAMTAEFLEREDDHFEVETVTTASNALALLAGGDFDCVVSDYDMPGQDGLEFLDAVREEFPDLPFVLFTGKGSEEIASEAISAGVTDYLQKERGTDQYTVLANRIANAVERWRAERDAAQTRDRLEAITSSSTDVILTVDSNDTIRFANPAAADVFGYSPSELVGEPLSTLLPVLGDETHEHSLPRPLATDQAPAEWRTVEVPGRHRDGHEVPLSISFGTFERDDSRRFVGILRDVSEQYESRRRLETLISNLPGIVYRCRNEAGWPMEHVRGECRELVGYSSAALEAGEVSWGEDILHPDDRETMWDAVQESIVSDEPFEVTYRIVTREGDTRWMWERGRAVSSEDGEQAIEGFITDVTDRETDRRELERKSALLSTLFETLPVGVLAEDADRNVLAVNDRMFELFDALDTPDEVLGADCERLARQASDAFTEPETFVDRTNNHIEREEPRRNEEFELHDGRTFARSFEPIELPDGKGYLWVYHEISERKEREEHLERANEQLEEFTSVVSHDLQSPLSIAQGRLDLARTECDSDHLDEVDRAHARMGLLIDDLLDLAQSGVEVGNVEAVDLAGLGEQCWRTVDTADASLHLETDHVIRADRSRLQQLFENLYRNAVEHGGPDVQVTVGSFDGGFFVEDDGDGILPEERDAVFEAGYSTSANGTGFGLRIVQRIVEAHGWEISVVSGAAGGARFEVRGVDVVEE